MEPKPGRQLEAQVVLRMLDEKLATTPGLIFSFVTAAGADRLGRIALWHSKEEANQVAMRDDILALRARLRSVALSTEETLMQLDSGYLPEPVAALFCGDVELEPVAIKLGAVA
jgi:hypothetical protein